MVEEKLTNKQKEDKLKAFYKAKGIKIASARRIKGVIKNFQEGKNLIKSIVPPIEPVLFLHKRGGKVETWDTVTSGRFVFTHSCGEQRFIDITPEAIEHWEYFGNTFRGIDAHEDIPFAGFKNALISCDEYGKALEILAQNYKRYEASLLTAQSKLNWSKIMPWFLGIGAVILTIALAALLIPWDKIFGSAEPIVQAVVNSTELTPSLS